MLDLFNFNVTKKLHYATLVLLLLGTTLAAQKATLTGRVEEASTSAPLGYASIRVFQVADNQVVGGGLTDENGTFSIQIPLGELRAEVEFLGFDKILTAPFGVTKDQPKHDLGILRMNSKAVALGEAEVRAEKSTMVLALDKKVFNVGKDLANAGGSATEILSNIPSVSVDVEGGVKLRGSDNVRILIDGKPSGLVSFKGSSGLQQLPANMIERIEIITNPSARYEAEGSAGIINIVLKKDQRQGFNGSFELVGGYPVNYGAAANLNYRHRKINFFINYGISWRVTPGGGIMEQVRTAGDSTYWLRQTTDNEFRGLNNNIRGGVDYFFSEKSILTMAYMWRRSDGQRRSYLRYEDFANNLNTPLGYTLRNQDETEDEPNSEYQLVWKRKFRREGHELTAEAKYLNYWEHSLQLFPQNTYRNDGSEVVEMARFQQSLNDEYENQYLAQVDYSQPVGKKGKLEAGLRSSWRDMVNDYLVTERAANGQMEALPGLDNYFTYQENINGLYGIAANQHGRFSWQAGLRWEHTDVTTALRDTDYRNPRRYANFFPSAHLTWQLPNNHAIQASYSRRIRRPTYNDLSPFFTYTDERNYWSGNPDLQPEFSDVYEIGHVRYFERGSLASSVYYRHTANKMERIRTLDAQGFAKTYPQNLRAEDATGVEFTCGYAPLKWWKLDFNANFFYADIDGSNLSTDFQAQTRSWFFRQTSKFSLPRHLDLQVRANYEAPQKTAQGSRKSIFFMDLSASKDIFDRNGTLTFSVLDAFNSRKWRSVTEGPNFRNEGTFQWRRRQFNLTLNYRIRQNKGTARRMLEE
jgi:ferric enterobactin receptor